MRTQQKRITQRSLPPLHPYSHARSKANERYRKELHEPQPWLMVIGRYCGKAIAR